MKDINLRSLIITTVIGLIIWFIPVPDGVKPNAWHLLAIFAATIIGIIIKAAPMGTIAMNTDVEKVLFSIDWPFANEKDGKKFWEDLSKSGIYDEHALEQIAWKNSAALFKLEENTVMRTVADQK